MKLDSTYIANILVIMEREPDYVINSLKLMSILKVKGEKAERKFMGHILVLADKGLIESLSSKHPFGFIYGLEGEYSIVRSEYRLTALGYEMLALIHETEKKIAAANTATTETAMAEAEI